MIELSAGFFREVKGKGALVKTTGEYNPYETHIPIGCKSHTTARQDIYLK